ncbi:hypothetical protein COV94_07150, partial [Candidatus Woesearchaeota archaeon CG11_big_fil_rev_8_21_14_0_20_57_5]
RDLRMVSTYGPDIFIWNISTMNGSRIYGNNATHSATNRSVSQDAGDLPPADAYGGETKLDWILVRTYATSEPTVSVGPEVSSDEVKGTISTSSGATPFWITNGSPLWQNPQNVTVAENASVLLTWWVNATGSGTYEFFAYANSTTNLSVGANTTHWNVSIQTPNNAPNISDGSGGQPAILPNPAYTTDNLSVTLNISDADSDTLSVQVNWTNGSTLLYQQNLSIAATPAGVGLSLNLSWQNTSWGTTVNATIAASDGSTTTLLSMLRVITNRAPTVTLHIPQNNTVYNNSRTAALNYTPIDSDNDTLSCELYLNSGLWQSNATVPSGSTQQVELSGLNATLYSWNA